MLRKECTSVSISWYIYQCVTANWKQPKMYCKFFSLCGFCDAITIKNINELIIDKIENYVKKDLVSLIQKLRSLETPTLVNEADFFGNTQLFDPSSFKFSIGERIQIEEIASFLKSIVAGSNLKYGIKNFTNKSKIVNYKGTVVYPHFGRFFSNENKSCIEIIKPKVHLQSTLFDNIFKLFESVNVKKETLEKFHKDMVSIHMDEDIIIGYVKCLLCDEENVKRKQNQFSIGCKSEGDKCYWISSNFKKHITKIHRLQSTAAVESDSETNRGKRKNKIHTIEVNSILKPVDENHTIGIDETKNENLETEIDQKENMNEYQYIGQSTYTTDNFEDKKLEAEGIGSTVGLVIQSVDTSNEVYSSLHSIIYNQVSSQLLRMLENADKNGEEQIEMSFICANKVRTLKTVSIAGDGNCIFGAFAHQLYDTNLKSKDHSMMTEQLRSKVVSYIRENRSSFKYELQNRVYDKFPNISIENMDAECSEFILNLSKNGFWGGCETIKAVYSIFQVNILIINENDGYYFPIRFDPSFEKTLLLGYKLCQNRSSIEKRNHYDSIIHIDAEDIFNITRLVANNMQDSTEIIIDESLDSNEIIVIDESLRDQCA